MSAYTVGALIEGLKELSESGHGETRVVLDTEHGTYPLQRMGIAGRSGPNGEIIVETVFATKAGMERIEREIARKTAGGTLQ